MQLVLMDSIVFVGNDYISVAINLALVWQIWSRLNTMDF